MLVSNISSPLRKVEACRHITLHLVFPYHTSSRPPNIFILKLWLKRSSLRLLSFTIIILLTKLRIGPPQSVDSSTVGCRVSPLETFLPGAHQLLFGLSTYGTPNPESVSFQLGNWKTNEIDDINNIFLSRPLSQNPLLK